MLEPTSADTRRFRAGKWVGHLVRLAAVVSLIFGAAQAAHADGRSGNPQVTIRLLPGYGLSTTSRKGWLRVSYRQRDWWISPADLVPQPCFETFRFDGGARGCILDPVYGAWIK